LPFTPFHFGTALIIFAIGSFLDPFSLFIGSIVPDIEGITALFLLPDSNLPLHGPLHSFTGALLLGIISGLIVFLFMKLIKLQEVNYTFIQIKFNMRNSIISGLLGTFSHIILDGPLYPEMNLIYPIEGNFIYQIIPYSWPYMICIVGSILGSSILFYKYNRHIKSTKKPV
jgi:membrane-bound metal-dependent hydrolase YbcI (DUF457 family)